MADSIYDELDEPDDSEPETEPLGPPPAGDVFVCDHVDDDGLCGASFDNQRSLNMHALGKHRDHSKDKPRAAPSKKRAPDKRPNSRSRKPAAAKAASTAIAPTDRASTYASSIAMAALGAYLVISPFDTYDLDIINRGAPNLADALASAGEQNQTIRTTCDLILGGGAGGAYIQLLLALSAMVVPICAHHGLVPASAGARFGEMIGAQPSPAAPTASASTGPEAGTTTGASGPPDWSNMSGPEILDHFAGLDQTVLFGLAGKMMGMMNPDVVDIGNVPQGDVLNLSMEQSGEEHDGERGSEQLAPVSVPTPA